MSSSSGIPPLPPSVAEAPKKKRRTLKDAETELEESRNALQDARKKLILTVRALSAIVIVRAESRQWTETRRARTPR